MLSNLSKIPPCPGIIVPKSFILQNLFIAEKDKSPICPAILAIIAEIIICNISKFILKNVLAININKVYENKTPIIPPIAPSTVFLGLIFGHNFSFQI